VGEDVNDLTFTASFSPNLIQDVREMLIVDFMRHAFLAGTVLAIVAGLVGYFVVLRNLVFATEALSHVTFTGALGAAILGYNPLLGLFGVTMLVALSMGANLGTRAWGTVLEHLHLTIGRDQQLYRCQLPLRLDLWLAGATSAVDCCGWFRGYRGAPFDRAPPPLRFPRSRRSSSAWRSGAMAQFGFPCLGRA